MNNNMDKNNLNYYTNKIYLCTICIFLNVYYKQYNFKSFVPTQTKPNVKIIHIANKNNYHINKKNIFEKNNYINPNPIQPSPAQQYHSNENVKIPTLLGIIGPLSVSIKSPGFTNLYVSLHKFPPYPHIK
jgi:hypothetical protein